MHTHHVYIYKIILKSSVIYKVYMGLNYKCVVYIKCSMNIIQIVLLKQTENKIYMLLTIVNMPYIKTNYHFPKFISKRITAKDNLLKMKWNLYSVFVAIVKCRYGNALIILIAWVIIIGYKCNLYRFLKDAWKRKTTESIDKKRVIKNKLKSIFIFL